MERIGRKFMFALIFSIILIVLACISIKSGKFLDMFLLMLLFLPDYYGIDFSDGLPILTATRIAFVTFYIYFFIKYKYDAPKIRSFRDIRTETWFLIGYFILRIFSNLQYVTMYNQSVKTIFSILFEQLLLCIVAYNIRLTKGEYLRIIRNIVYVAAVIFVLGIWESFTSYRIASLLYTVSRPMLNLYDVRLGFLRSTVMFGMPGFYGNFCVIILPMILFMYEYTRQKRYLIIIFLDIYATIHSGCRSSLFFCGIIVLLAFIMIKKDVNRRIIFVKNGCCILLVLICITSLLSIVSPYARYYYVGTGKSMLNEIGFEFNVNEGAPEGVNGYGINKDSGTTSRIIQLTGIEYVMTVNPVFGLGSGAQNRGDVYYRLKDGKWHSIKTYDVGYVEMFMDEGIVGIVAFISLCIFCVVKMVRIRKCNKSFECLITKSLFLCQVAYLICLLSTANQYNILFLLIFILIVSDELVY